MNNRVREHRHSCGVVCIQKTFPYRNRQEVLGSQGPGPILAFQPIISISEIYLASDIARSHGHGRNALGNAQGSTVHVGCVHDRRVVAGAVVAHPHLLDWALDWMAASIHREMVHVVIFQIAGEPVVYNLGYIIAHKRTAEGFPFITEV